MLGLFGMLMPICECKSDATTARRSLSPSPENRVRIAVLINHRERAGVREMMTRIVPGHELYPHPSPLPEQDLTLWLIMHGERELGVTYGIPALLFLAKRTRNSSPLASQVQ
jgi:hypothetical protein